MPLPDLLSDPQSAARVLVDTAPFYVSGEDALESRAFNTAAGVTLAIVGRMLLLTGEIVPFAFAHTPNSAGTLDVQRFKLSEGWILNLAVLASAGTPTGTQCLDVLRIVRGTTANAQALGVLAQGAITASQELSWPPTLTSGGASSAAATGTARAVTGTDPAAGAEISETVPVGKTWILHAFGFSLVTSAVVANRTPHLVIDDGANTIWQNTAPSAQTASSTRFYPWSDVGVQDGSATDYFQMALPVWLKLPAGCRIRTSTFNLDVGDNYAAPHYLVEEF